MGNKMCKKKTDTVDNSKTTTPSTIDRIITRLHLKPNSWKSESHLNSKQNSRSENNSKDKKNGSIVSPEKENLSKSSDWTEASLEVPETEAIHLKNPQLSFIFNDNTTPTPPPRKHKKSIREKIESVAKNSIQALQSMKSNDDSKKTQIEPLTLANETLCVKKVINYSCPCQNRENCTHQKQNKVETQKSNQKKESKRKKNLSVISLPNYNDLKFSVANTDQDLKFVDSSNNNSSNSLPGEEKHAGKLENYMTRCRSFGSLLNNKLKVPKQTTDIESDDSFGGLEDWDLGILEHYNPKDASLPRTRKTKNKKDILYDVENLVVSDIEIKDKDETPERPLRRSESLKKKTSLESTDATNNALGDTGSPSDKTDKVEVTEKVEEVIVQQVQPSDDPTEHSTLMKILQEYSVKDVKERSVDEPSSVKIVTEETKLLNSESISIVDPKDDFKRVKNQMKS